jgi:hypothetical protein
MCGTPCPQAHKLFKHMDGVMNITLSHCRQLVMNIKLETHLVSSNLMAQQCHTTFLSLSLSTQTTLPIMNARMYISTTR